MAIPTWALPLVAASTMLIPWLYVVPTNWTTSSSLQDPDKVSVSLMTLEDKIAYVRDLDDLSKASRQAKLLEVIESTKSGDLVKLRRAADNQLVPIARILKPDILDRIMAHIQAQVVVDGAPRFVKVISDIDDTLFPNLHDQSWPGVPIYPGIRMLYFTFHDCLPIWDDVAFLTARPDGFEHMFRWWTLHQLSEKGLPNVTVISSRSIALTKAGKARRKFNNYLSYKQFYPDYQFVLVGDSGEGDVVFMQKVLRERNHQVALALIHDVVDKRDRPKTSPTERMALLAQGIHVFDNYLEASIAAFEAGLVNAHDLAHVRDSFNMEIRTVQLDKEELRTKRIEQARAAFIRAEELIMKSTTRQ